MSSTIVEDVANHLADMPGQTLPIYTMQFPPDVRNCIAIFPTGGGVGGNIGSKPTQYTTATGIGYLDYPGVQVQIRHGDPFNAYYYCEEVRKWLDSNLPSGYVRCDTNDSIPIDLTNTADLEAEGGPMYRYKVDFSFIKIR